MSLSDWATHHVERRSLAECATSMHRVSVQLLPRSVIQFIRSHALYVSGPKADHLCENLFNELTNRIKRLRPSKVRRPRTLRSGRRNRSAETLSLIFIYFLWFGFRYWFHSHLKVLCIFPSQYFFAIGLCIVFSFGWNLPSILRSNLKERDSWFGCSFTVT